MNFKTLCVGSLSLMLIGCATFKPTQPSVTGSQGATLTNVPEPFEQLQIKFKLPQAFKTQFADYQSLAFVQFEVDGEGLTSVAKNDGSRFLQVNNDEINGTISNLPFQNKGWRVVTVKGFDQDKVLLPAFTAKAIYQSNNKKQTVTLSASRVDYLLGLYVEYLIKQKSAKLSSFDIDVTRNLFQDAQLYNSVTGSMNFPPEQFDQDDLFTAMSSESPPASGLEIRGLALSAKGTVSIQINTQTGAAIGEDVLLMVTDPSSDLQLLPSGTNSGETFTLPGVSPGNWRLEARTRNGTLLDSTTLSLSHENVLELADESLLLTGVALIEP